MRPRLARLAAVTAALALAAGCSSQLGTGPSGEERGDALAVTVQANALRLENLTEAPLFYVVGDPSSLALIDLNPCTTLPQTCTNVVPARGSRTVPFTEVVGFSSFTSELQIHHWNVVPRAGGAGNEARWFPTMTVRVR